MTTTDLELATLPAWRTPFTAALRAAGLAVRHQSLVGLSITPGRAVLPEVDQWSVESRPHLLVGVWDHGIEVGPWAQPGMGPCARCVEAATFGSVPAERATLPPPADLAVASGRIAREVTAFVRGHTPTTWGTSWLLTDDPVPTARPWRRHPYCGCAWYETA